MTDNMRSAMIFNYSFFGAKRIPKYSKIAKSDRKTWCIDCKYAEKYRI